MSSKPFLLIQSRPEMAASDDEYRAFMNHGGLSESSIVRLRIDQGELPSVSLDDYSGVLMGGGPANIAYKDEQKSDMQKQFEPWLFNVLQKIIAEDKPFLGACLAMGAVVKVLGGQVSFDYTEPVGASEITLLEEAALDPLLVGMPMQFSAFVGHKEGVGPVPEQATILATSSECTQLIRVGKNVYASQFHPELDPAGLALRVGVYKNAGYFDPEEADDIIAAAWQSEVREPVKILRRFVELYSS